MFCPSCGFEQPSDHRFCVACGFRLPRELLSRRGPKLSRWFWTVPVAPEDPAEAALRVTRYLESFDMETAEGSVRVPSHHVRFSVWVVDRPVCAVSLPDSEAEAVAEFILSSVGDRTTAADHAPTVALPDA